MPYGHNRPKETGSHYDSFGSIFHVLLWEIFSLLPSFSPYSCLTKLQALLDSWYTKKTVFFLLRIHGASFLIHCRDP